jgi:hypothetical protein
LLLHQDVFWINNNENVNSLFLFQENISTYVKSDNFKDFKNQKQLELIECKDKILEQLHKFHQKVSKLNDDLLFIDNQLEMLNHNVNVSKVNLEMNQVTITIQNNDQIIVNASGERNTINTF